MHSHGNRTPPPQNEPSLNNPNNSSPAAASSQTAPAVPVSVSTPSTVQAHGSSVSNSPALSTSATTAPATSSLSAPSTAAPKALSAPAANGQTGNAAGHAPGTPNTTADQLKNTQNSKRTAGKDAKTTPATALTHTNAAATPTAKPKTLRTLAAKDFTDAPKTLAVFLQRIKSAPHTSDNNQQTTPAGSLPRAAVTLPNVTATLPAKQSTIGPKTSSPLTRSKPTVGPQYINNENVTRFYVDPNDDGHIQIEGHNEQLYHPKTWVHIVVCPREVRDKAVTGRPGHVDSRCTDIETYTDGHTGGYGDGGTLNWGPGSVGRDPIWTTRDSDFKTTPDHSHAYDIWIYNTDANWNHYDFADASNDYYCSQSGRKRVTLTYDMSGMPNASTPGSQEKDTSYFDFSTTFASEPSHPSWQIFDGWSLKGTNYNAGQAITFPAGTDGIYTVTPRWHVKPTSVKFNYNLNGMSGSTPGSQQVNTTNNGGSITLAYPPSHPDWQIFDGWTVDGWNNMTPGQTYSVGIHDESTHTVTARWHVRPDTVTIHYQDNGSGCSMPGNQTADSGNYSNTTLAGTPSCPAHTVFDGWTINYNNYNPGGTFNFAQHVTATYTATARTHTINAPTGLAASYHANDNTVTLTGAGDIAAGDTVTACMTDGTGNDICHSATPVALPASSHPTVSGSSSHGLTVTGITKSGGQVTLSGRANGGWGGGVVKVRLRSCPASYQFSGGTGWGGTSAPSGCNETEATGNPHFPGWPTWLGEQGNFWTGSIAWSPGQKLWVYIQTQGASIDGPLLVNPDNTNGTPTHTNWTINFPAGEYTAKYGYGHQHHFTAKLTSNNAESELANLQGTLPWTTVNFDKGDGTGTAPDSVDALTDTIVNKATPTIPGQGSMTAPAHAWPDFTGWSDGTTLWQPGSRDIPTNTSGATTTDGHTTLTLTAQWHTVQAPTNLTAAYHITGTVTLTGTSNVQSGDKITACMTEGTGDTTCQPAITASNADSAWQWTVTFPATDYTTKYGYGHQHHFTAKLTSKGVDSTTADLQGTLPWTTLTFDKGASGGTAPDAKDALTDTSANKATFTLPGQGSMTTPANAFPDFTGWSDGTNLWQPGSRDIPTNASGATTGPDGHTTLTLTAKWHIPDAPTGVTVRYSHTDNLVYLTATGLQTGITNWKIEVKPTTTDHFHDTSNTLTTGESAYYVSMFTPGDTWTARARATYTDTSGNRATSDWSTEITGVLPYMTANLKPGSQQTPGGGTAVKGLVDTGEGKAYLTLPVGVGTPPDGMSFQSNGGWATNPNGTGQTYNAGDTTIPTTAGTPGGTSETKVTLYAQWRMRTQAPARGQACTSVAGWQQWGTSAGAINGITGQDTGAVCYTIEGSTLRLTGGTSPNYRTATDIPWDGRKSAITKVSIEGDVTFTTSAEYGGDSHPLADMTNLTSIDSNGHTINLDRNCGTSFFSSDSSLTSLDLTGWKTRTLTDMVNMFGSCTSLKTETLKGIQDWDISSVRNMNAAFQGDTALTGLDLSGWKTSSLTASWHVFYDCPNLTDLDISGWDTNGTSMSSGMLPANLQRLRLGTSTKLKAEAFDQIATTTAWHEWDWPQGHHPSDLGLVGATAGTPGDGTLTTLEARTASAHPEGTYIRSDVNPTWTDLTYDLNGGTGDASLPAQIGQAATGGQPKRDGLAIDTTFKDGEYTIPDGTTDTGNAAHHITANKPHSLFNGWTIDTGNVTANASGGTATVSNHTITAAKGAGGTATVAAQWTSTPQAMPGTPAVTVTPRTTDQGGISVSVTATLGQSMPAIDASNGDPAKPAVSAGGTVKVCAKPSSQNADFYSVQCSPKTSTTGGSQTITPEALQLPGSSAISGNAPAFPDPGEQYTLAAMYTLTDPQTRNQIDSTATQAGGGLTTGTLPWADTTFDTNDSHGGNGTPPTDAKSFVDTASGKAWASLPNATATMTPEHTLFAGWSATASAANPDQGMGDPASRIIQLDATTGATETQTTLYAVWHKLTAPTVTGIKRNTLTNTITVTGTATPWTAQEGVGLDLTPLDSQGGLTPAGTRYATISPTDQQGNPLAYDGHTAHPWTLTLTANDLSTGGRYRADAKIRAMDQAWRDTNAGFYVYSAAASSPTNLPGYFQHSLPLTGGQRTMLIIALALLGVFLTGMSQLARNRRRWHHQ
ncbi:BspA family leucine-rich repeat surface protein [Bifidobacterium sp. ESL0769]|uniref:BspA family leucine-rich repeat surface protein n=1 Tax=Bifidobacterium sp. ESL0769 TaxID=2983229 RepID=UPI0023F6C21D|nr:BspA family leucine-rich repeat surface protein [Bifidobacterium sp. ESL0769]WEV67436.1 BspA family leucine-rich repeat surface protein [Bifidobacterium sp. ESL0769]